MAAKRTAKQRKASADNLKRARAAKSRGQVPVSTRGANVPTPVNKTITPPKSLVGTSAYSGGFVSKAPNGYDAVVFRDNGAGVKIHTNLGRHPSRRKAEGIVKGSFYR